MSLQINQNVGAINAHRNLVSNDNMLSKSLERLSSGFRINRAADDAAGLIKSETLRSEIRGTQQAVRNAQDGISFVQTAEGSLNEVHSMLQRMNELAVSAANTATSDGSSEQTEIDELLLQITAIGVNTKFAGLDVFGADVTFHVGANSGENIVVATGALSAATVIGVVPVDVTTASGDADLAIGTIATAIDNISTLRGSLGAKQNRLESTINNLRVSVENLSASESRIRDTDMALEMSNFTRNQIMVQAGTSMLAQANAMPQNILSLLR